MSSIVFLCALCFGTTVEAFQTMTHSDHLDVMHEPLYILILASIDLIVWGIVFRSIGGYTFHQRTAFETDRLRNISHYPSSESYEMEDQKTLVEGEKQCNDTPKDCSYDSTCDRGTKMKDNSKTIFPFTLEKINSNGRSFFDDPRYDLSNLSRDLIPCFILISNCLIVYSIDQKEFPNVPKYVDPIMALLTIGFLIISSASMTKKAGLILLQSLPEEMEDTEVLCRNLKSSFSKYIVNIHEAHVWCLVPNAIYATLHITFKDMDSYLSTKSEIESFLLTYGVNHVTIQPEFENDLLLPIESQKSSKQSLSGSIIETEESDDNAIRCKNEGKQRNMLMEQLLETPCLLPCPTKDCLKKSCCLPDEMRNGSDL